jgi:hypothetical protein
MLKIYLKNEEGHLFKVLNDRIEAVIKAQEIANTTGEGVEVTEVVRPKRPAIERIKTFQDALDATGRVDETKIWAQTLTESEIARRKLHIIAEALNEDWAPDWTNEGQEKWYPWFYFDGLAIAGVRFSSAYSIPSTATASIGVRLCYKSEEISDYAGEQFRELYQQIFDF